MATQLKLRGGTTAQHASFTGAEKEVTVDTTKDTLVVHDGSTAGGFPLAKESAIASKANADGSNATGEWDIDISGNAATATAATTATSATSATNATNATKLVTANWTIEQVSGEIRFLVGGVAKAKLDSNGNLTVVGNVTAYGTI
jgi:hypothetical protein